MTEKRQIRKLWQYWYEEFPNYIAIWQVIAVRGFEVTIKLIYLDGEHNVDLGETMEFRNRHFNDEKVWTPIKKADIPLIVLKNMRR